IEREVILAPDHQQARPLLAHPCLPLRIGLHVGSIVVEQIALNVGLAGLIEKIKFIGPEIGVIAIHVGIVSDVARARRRQRQEICAKRAFVGSAIGPKARRVFQFAPRPSLCATASWTMSASMRSGWAKAMRKPTGPRRRNPASKACSARARALR